MTREEELVFKRGFDAGIEFQKKAETPKAKQYRGQRDVVIAALVTAKARIHSDICSEDCCDACRAAATAIAEVSP